MVRNNRLLRQSPQTLLLPPVPSLSTTTPPPLTRSMLLLIFLPRITPEQPAITLPTAAAAPVSPPAGSFTINNNTATTASGNVTLNLSATDNTGVTGYYASENSTTPTASQTGWTTVTSAIS